MFSKFIPPFGVTLSVPGLLSVSAVSLFRLSATLANVVAALFRSKFLTSRSFPSSSFSKSPPTTIVPFFHSSVRWIVGKTVLMGICMLLLLLCRLGGRILLSVVLFSSGGRGVSFFLAVGAC